MNENRIENESRHRFLKGAAGLALARYFPWVLAEGAGSGQAGYPYPLARIGDMPRVEVHIVPSTANPTGIGMPGVPPPAPAVVNALAAAAGKRVRRLPITADMLKA